MRWQIQILIFILAKQAAPFILLVLDLLLPFQLLFP